MLCVSRIPQEMDSIQHRIPVVVTILLYSVFYKYTLTNRADVGAPTTSLSPCL
jgi:hypothetical protein